MTAATQPARLLGIPLGDFGLFSAMLLALAAGFLAFFGTCFLAILGLLFWNLIGHHHVNYADSYQYVAFPVGVAVLAIGLVFFIATWLRRRVAGTH
jgi:hypothetical protein